MFFLLITVFAVAVFAGCGNETECMLCQSVAHHAPCLLVDGQLGELTVYDPHPVTRGALAEEQQKDTLQFVWVGEWTGIRDTGAWIAQIEVPCDAGSIENADLCDDCRKQLVVCDGPALLDLYTPGSPVIYPITEGAAYEMRCYIVDIQTDEEQNNYCITVKGTLIPQ